MRRFAAVLSAALMMLAVFAAPAEAKKFKPPAEPRPDGCYYDKHGNRECYTTVYDDDFTGPTHGQPCVTEDGQPGTIYHQRQPQQTYVTYYDTKRGTSQTYEYPLVITDTGPYCRPLV